MIKRPFVTKKEIEEIAATYPTPFHLYDEKGIRQKARDLRQAFSWNKGFKEYFAVKATPTPAILNILKEEGCGVDCATLTELVLSERCGFQTSDIMFSSNDTPAEDFQKAFEIGAIINLDDFTHIDFLAEVAGIPKTISLRYNPGGVVAFGNGIMDNPGESKYGMTREQLFLAVEKLQKLGVEKFGLHSFVASNTLTNDYYPMHAKNLFHLAVELHETLGATIDFVNLSGGIGVDYKPEDVANDIFVIGEGVRLAFEEILTKNNLNEVKIFTELGRFMLAPHGGIVTKTIHEKHTYKEYIGVDASAVDLIRPAMYGAYHHLSVLGKEEAKETETYDVVGGLCENNDKFAIDRSLPKIEKGDFLFIHDTGAHGHSMGYNYNGKLKSAELLLTEKREIRLIRRAETIEDYFATIEGFE